jgi:hypothetical protein
MGIVGTLRPGTASGGAPPRRAKVLARATDIDIDID